IIKREKMKKISIIVPVYKAEKFLCECIDSILCQTYKNLEVILVDDGSPDNSGMICDKYAQSDSRIKVVHQQNGGAGKARNAGIDKATGDYIMFLDSDDWMEYDMAEKLVIALEKNNADQVRCGCYYVSPQNKDRVTFKSNKILEAETYGEIMESEYSGVLWTVPWNAIYRRKIIKNVKFPEGYINEDNYFSPMYVYYCKKIVLLQEALVNTRVWDGNVSSGVNKRPLDRLAVRFKLRRDLLSLGFFSNKVNKRIATEAYHYIHKFNKYMRLRAIQKDLLNFILNNLDLRRKIILHLDIFMKRIKTKE
ncbi:MAG: glycosyltransferase, partial [Acidaminococcaceae bacterium]|nr:glycosyltransferase [Acidaminococcaceae bacterium]